VSSIADSCNTGRYFRLDNTAGAWTSATGDNLLFWGEDLRKEPAFLLLRYYELIFKQSKSGSETKIWQILGFHSSAHEECRLLECDAVWLFVRTEVSKKIIASIIRIETISELVTKLAITSYCSPLSSGFLQEPHGVTSQKTAFFK
jgi:hypothetical protein